MENSIHFFKNSTPRKILPPPQGFLGGGKKFLGGGICPPQDTQTTSLYRMRQFYQSFACKDKNFQAFLFCTYVRPMLESNSIVWNPHNFADIDKLENMQRKFRKYIPGLFNVPYFQKLIIMDIETPEVRRVKAEPLHLKIFIFKMIKKWVEIDYDRFFSYNING